MTDFITEFITYYDGMSLAEFIRMYWYFMLFDFTRYIVGDYLVLILFFIMRRHQGHKYQKAKEELFSELPLVSVISPGKNEGRHIPALVNSLRRQSYKNYELIIVDDGSDDDTSYICNQMLKKGLIDSYIRNDVRGGKASAANLGLRFSRGKFVVHVDADTHLDEKAIENIIIPFYLDKKIGAVGGDVRVANSEQSITAALQAIEYLKSISVGRRVASILGILRIIPGALGAFRKDILNNLKGWDVGPGLDGDLSIKIRKLGYKIFMEPSAFCFTNVPITLLKLAKQRYRWDRSLVRFRFRKHRDVFLPTEIFRFKDFLSFLENLFFNFILNIKWWIYIIDMVLNYPSLVKFIIPMNYILYFISNILQYIVGIILLGNTITRRELKLSLYLPLVPLYAGLYIRIVRTYAYFNELLFRVSYKDQWNPRKVSRKVLEKNL